MTIWEAFVGHPSGLSEMSGDLIRERVTAHIGPVFPEQVSRSNGVAGDRGTNNFDVVAFPVDLPVTGMLTRRSVNGEEIDDGKPKGRIGGHSEPQCGCSKATVDGPLRLAIPRRRVLVCSYRTAVVLDGQP